MQQLVRERAGGLCEYCHASEKWQYVHFTIDHVLPLSKGGTDSSDNLALACFHCNRRKSSRTTATDPDTGEIYAFFNPRRMIWAKHFIWSQDAADLIGLTSIGRATIAQLDLNNPRLRTIRLDDVAVGRHPPVADLVMNRFD